MKNTIKIFNSFVLLLFIIGCSTKKDTFINRNFNELATKYNVLYNGENAFNSGLEQLNSNYQDNFWERLPIEPLKVDALAIPGLKPDADASPKEFDKAEEKAVKAVQKHSMLIKGRERNNQIDEAYLLLGKARYYSKRFVPALEAFNFVLINYPTANLIDETKIWHAKTLVRLQNEEQAIKNLKYLLKDKELSEKNTESAYTTLAMAYSNLDSTKQVVKSLKKAVLTNYNKEQTARNLFILGQIYEEEKVNDTASFYFQKVIDLKRIPYKYTIRAYIEKAKTASNEIEEAATIKEFSKLIKDRENRPYLDALYYQKGMIENQLKSEDALTDFQKSLQATKTPNLQKELSYEAVANFYFNKAKYLTAANYYDSIINITKDNNSKRIRRIIRKRNNLNDVVNFENVAKADDSILTIAAMSKEQQTDYFNTYIEKLKKDAAKKQENINSGNAFLKTSLSLNQANNNSGEWYFYNIQTVGFGQQEFQKIWGNRPLEDNWRLSNKTQLPTNQNNLIKNASLQANDTLAQYSLVNYLAQIPTKKVEIDSLKSERNNAYYNLGLIYKEQFKQNNLAINKFEKLLNYNPNEELLIPTKYHLYKLYKESDAGKATELKNDLIEHYPTSKYVQLLNQSKQNQNEDEVTSLPEIEYNLLYYSYEEEQYDTVINQATLAITKYSGQPIVPKYELLKAFAIGKKEGLSAFKDALEFVAITYPTTEEGKKAKELISQIEAIKQ